MYGLYMMAKNNMKKQKGDMFTFFILTFIAALLIFDSISVLLGIGKVVEDRFRAVNGAHVMIYNRDTEAENDCAERAFREDPRFVDFERTPEIQFMTDYRKKGDKDFSVYSFFVESVTQEKRIMKVEVPEREYQKNDILLPYNQKANFAIGDVLQLKFGDDVYDFNVVGYLEDPYFCCTINITAFYVGMSQEMMDELLKNHPMDIAKGYANKGIADESIFAGGYTTADLENDVAGRYKEYLSEYSAKDPDTRISSFMTLNWYLMRGGSQFVPMIVSAIILLFAILILVIALVIISFSIKNFIQRNMKNTGILEASGYTVRELRTSLLLQILLVATVGAVVGVGVAIFTFGMFGDVISAVLGLCWNQPVNAWAAALTIFGLLFVIGLVGLLISRTYKKISVLEALRGGINTHNFKKNFFAFDKTPLPISVVLSLKDAFSGIGRNLIMVLISMILVVSTLVGFGLVETFAKNADGLMKLMAYEMCTDMVTASNGTKDISEDLRGLPGVENVLVNIGFEPTIIAGNKKSVYYAYAVDDLNNTTYTNLLEGRYPEKDNEILVTLGVAKDMGINVGDVVELEFAGKTAEFVITGINQRMERMGRSIYARIDGARKIMLGNVIHAYQYYVTARDGMTYEELRDEIARYGEEKGLELQHSDIHAMIESTIASVVIALKIVCIAITLITIIIVIFVESLVIRAKIAREWRSMGISKAIGQTSGGLIMQIMLSNIPAILTGAVIGGIFSSFLGGGLIKVVFSLFAVKKVVFNVPAIYGLLTVVGIVVVAILTSAMAGLKVRSLKPVTMITEE